MLYPALTVLAASLLAACGGGGDGPGIAFLPPATQPAGSGTTVSGVLTASAFKPGSSTDPVVAAGYYAGATVCVDSNGNGRCDTGEPAAVTDANGKFSLSLSAASALIADIGTNAKNTATNTKVATREVLRVMLDQVQEQGATVVVSPLSSEVARLVEANHTSYAVEKQNLATRLGVPAASLLGDLNAASGTVQTALLNEANALNNRFAYATTKLDRGDKFPDALANPGGDPRLTGMAGVTTATANVADNRKPITFLQSQQAAFNVEGIPRYDNIFIVMLENKATMSILNSAYAPKINGYLKAGNQLVSYYATGNPSEPNYTALGGADDWGITDDAQWNCDATGANAVQDTPTPDSSQPGLSKSPFAATCTQSAAVNHNIVGRPNLFNAITKAGLTWRTYSESMNPGQDFRTDSVADTSVSAKDNVYAPGTLGGNATAVGDATLTLPLPAGLYKTKHHPGMAYQNVRSAPEWKYSNRTMGGGQWDAALKNSLDYTIPAGYDYDQLGSDLASGNVGNLNFLVPDQCDDMHGISVKGTNGGGATGTASDCSSVANNVSATAVSPIITRGDNYVDYTVKRIQASALWKNPQKRVAIVLMFDEGNATSGFNSCCGWNPLKGSDPAHPVRPLMQNADGSWTFDPSINNYQVGNRGHGESIFGILTNQADAPKGVSDSDAYSHFSFVRTLQDMFQLADPTDDATYMNRSKYTEAFIAANIMNLPDYAGSADTHFDSVRPINHAFVIPASYTQKQSGDVSTTAQVGADTNQVNVWSLKQ
ncbi:phosphoesterase [Variovorax sp. J22G73]|uniref:phosphoesterase n=1 Tax=unclassified Variovorax TaxID=663243 RepID=UPI000D5DF0A2|nr:MULTISPECIES: phosphoesterase [unclassified Variovorax]MDM0009645.1 phosphoesterase [Variovorax sp. J22R203]MDM0102153.1 phosphoesterase [Variovorax sp. J22G73]